MPLVGIRTGIAFDVTAADRARLVAIIAAPTSAQKHVWRARIILINGNGLGTVAIMQATGKSKPCVWRWREPVMSEGVEGLLGDKSRPTGIAPLDGEIVERVVALTLETLRKEATHWTVRAMAKAVAENLHDVVGLYVSPPFHAIVLSVDEKSQELRCCKRNNVGLREVPQFKHLG